MHLRFACVLVAAVAGLLVSNSSSGQVDSTKHDSLKHDSLTFSPSNADVPAEYHFSGRLIEVVLGGGAGYYQHDGIAPFQAQVNADFYARTKDLIFAAGFHHGFSTPSTNALGLGIRMPISEQDSRHGLYGDAQLLLTDNGVDTNIQQSEPFETGLRGALALRSGIVEARIAAELRRSPFAEGKVEAWEGLELGVAIPLISSGAHESSRRDTIRQELRYIATNEELQELNTVAPEDLNRWLKYFWAGHDVAGEPKGEARHEYMARVKEANDKFSTENTLGASTDMGRILILYGNPSGRETGFSSLPNMEQNYHSVTQRALPSYIVVPQDRKFELWSYDNRIMGVQEAMFLFLDLHGIPSDSYSLGAGGTPLRTTNVPVSGRGDFQQIYSNIPGEHSESVPIDLPPSMFTYINNYRR
jgi:GWxTD domain-containing protein